MFGKSIRLSPLESQKQLLIAESELNREQLLEKWQTMTKQVHSFTDRAKTVGLIVSSAAALAAGLAVFRHGKTTGVDPKPSWLQTILKSTGTISTLWLAFHAPNRDPKEK